MARKRAAAFLCLWAGFLGALVCVLSAVYFPASRAELFERALLANVDAPSLGVDEEALRSFARETMAFLTGQKDAWEPSIHLYGMPAEEAIGQSFRDHMLSVRGWATAVPTVLTALGLAALGLACLSVPLAGFRRRACLLGAALAAALVAIALGWAVVDFDSLWMVLHRALIPDGIFPANEPVMRLFPLSLFFSYIGPVSIALALHLGLLLFLIWAPDRRRTKGTMK